MKWIKNDLLYRRNIVVSKINVFNFLPLEYMCHVYVRADNLAGVVISDHDYPHRVAHTLLTKVSDEYILQCSSLNS